jgi:hypothetical protein
VQSSTFAVKNPNTIKIKVVIPIEMNKAVIVVLVAKYGIIGNSPPSTHEQLSR